MVYDCELGTIYCSQLRMKHFGTHLVDAAVSGLLSPPHSPNPTFRQHPHTCTPLQLSMIETDHSTFTISKYDTKRKKRLDKRRKGL